jgi:2-oxoisovalerate dehydrogenase E2 component (dihydrolipoyl transacylase)
MAAACKAEPSLNAWYNAEAGERRLLSRVDVGIAVDLEGGLLVPVLRNVGERDSTDLRAGLDRMRADAAARSIPPEELRGATITLSNFGMIGGRFASLVVVPPQVAIIGAGRAEQRGVVDRGEQVIHRMLPLSLTFDHRAVTGGEAARFLATLRSPGKALMRYAIRIRSGQPSRIRRSVQLSKSVTVPAIVWSLLRWRGTSGRPRRHQHPFRQASKES